MIMFFSYAAVFSLCAFNGTNREKILLSCSFTRANGGMEGKMGVALTRGKCSVMMKKKSPLYSGKLLLYCSVDMEKVRPWSNLITAWIISFILCLILYENKRPRLIKSLR